jgi:hypothetical protein
MADFGVESQHWMDGLQNSEPQLRLQKENFFFFYIQKPLRGGIYWWKDNIKMDLREVKFRDVDCINIGFNDNAESWDTRKVLCPKTCCNDATPFTS